MTKTKLLSFLFLVSLLIVSSCTTTTVTLPPETETSTPPPETATSIPPVDTATATLPVATVTSTSTVLASTTTPTGDLPDMPTKPTPLDVPFNGCPPEGSGGDSLQNLLKNRSDEGNYVPVNFASIASLTWPATVQQKERKNWSAADKAAIAKYEGIPVVVEGYLAGAKESEAESTNCQKTASNMVDWHVWFVKNSGDSRAVSIVIEPTPRSRANHTWTLTKLKPIITNQIPVRISGWVFFDPEHPDQLGLTRGTLWEIHPVMQIEVLQNGQWVPLDNYVP